MHVLITGGASGIGYDLTKYFCEQKDFVYLNYLSSKKNALLLKEMYPDNIKLVPGDITDLQYINDLFNDISSLDLVINNACICEDTDIFSKTKTEFMRVLEVNLVAPFLIVKEYGKKFNTGMIINICSTDGIDTYHPYNVDYSASKAGLINLTKNLVNCMPNFKVYGIIPNYIDTLSTGLMDQTFLESELKRINQKELIKPEKVIKVINRIINGNYRSGYMERIDDNE